MGLSVTATFTGMDRFHRILERIKKNGTDMKPFLTSYGEYMKTIVRDSVDQERDPETGKRWPSLAKISALSRRNGAGHMLKGNTGNLVKSFVAVRPQVTATSVTIGSNLPYARVQQEGAVLKPKNKKLAIPLSVKAWRTGARRWKTQHKGFWFRSKSGKLFLAANVGGKLTFGFMMVDSVKIPARPYLGFGERDKRRFLHDAEAWLLRGTGI